MKSEENAGSNPIAVPAVEESWLTLPKILAAARKHVWIALACWVSVFAAVFFWTSGQRKTYRSETMLRLDPDPPRPLGTSVELVGQQPNYWSRREFYESEYRIMRSMRVATAAVRMLGLHGDPGFFGVKASAGFRPVSVEDAARTLLGRLSVEPVRDSSLAVLRFEDYDPVRAQSVLSAVVKVYLSQNMEGTTSVSTTALDWLNTQLATLKVDLEKSETALSDFKSKNNVLSVSLEDRHNIITTQLEQLSKEATTLDVRRVELTARRAELAKVKALTPMDVGATELLNNSLLAGLRGSYAEQLRVVQEITANYGEDHPKVKAARAKLDAAAKLVIAEVDNIKSSVARDLRSVERQIADLKVLEAELQKQAHELQAFEVPYNQLNRTKNNNEKLYGLVLERARQTDLTRVMHFNNIQVIDEAAVPRVPFRPNVPLNLAVGCVAGLLVGVLAAIGREIADRTLRTPADVETLLGVTCLGLLPDIATLARGRTSRRKVQIPAALQERDLIVAANPESGVAEAARVIRSNLMFASPDRPYRSLVITSALPAEGKTTVACSLATVLAQSGLRVVIVDTDLRRPRLHRTFGVPNDVGVTMLISGSATLEDAIEKTDIEGLSVLPSGPIPPNPAEMLHSHRFQALVDSLMAKYDRVIFDSPPILPVTDAAIISRCADGVIVVARGQRTPKTAARQAVRHLRDVRAHIIGMVLNAIDLGRGEYRGYHYYYRRDGYYAEDSKAA